MIDEVIKMTEYSDGDGELELKPGDVVRVKPMFYKPSIGGHWVAINKLQKNWRFRRPDDYVGHSTHKFLRAKPYQVEKVMPTPTPTPVKKAPTPVIEINLHDAQFEQKFVMSMAQADDAAKLAQLMTYDTPIKSMPDNATHTPVLSPGTMVIINSEDPHEMDGLWAHGSFAGLWTVTQHHDNSPMWITVAPLFGGKATTIKSKYVTVIPEKDLTITYLPQ